MLPERPLPKPAKGAVSNVEAIKAVAIKAGAAKGAAAPAAVTPAQDGETSDSARCSIFRMPPSAR